jgi:hypothetical protein
VGRFYQNDLKFNGVDVYGAFYKTALILLYFHR